MIEQNEQHWRFICAQMANSRRPGHILSIHMAVDLWENIHGRVNNCKSCLPQKFCHIQYLMEQLWSVVIVTSRVHDIREEEGVLLSNSLYKHVLQSISVVDCLTILNMYGVDCISVPGRGIKNTDINFMNKTSKKTKKPRNNACMKILLLCYSKAQRTLHYQIQPLI